MSLICLCKEAVENHAAFKHEGVLVDVQTASIIIKVHDGLNEDNRKRLLSYPVGAIAGFAWRCAK